MATSNDKLVYFSARARGEAIRMLYVVAGKEFEDKIVTDEEWTAYKPGTPLGQLPTLTTADGVLCMSNVIARHVARKLGLAGNDQWEETLHDLVTECAQDGVNIYATPNIYTWLVFKSEPTPENSEELLKKVKDKWTQILNYVQSIAEGRGKKYIVGDELGLAEIFLYAALEFCRIGTPEVMSHTEWSQEFVAKVAEDPKLKQYLAVRPASVL